MVLGPHVDLAVEPEEGAGGGRGDPVLARAGLGHHPPLAHPNREQGLAQGVVDFVGAGVGEVLALEEQLGTADMLGPPPGLAQRCRPADIAVEQNRELPPERGIGAGREVRRLELRDRRHQGLGHEAPPRRRRSSRARRGPAARRPRPPRRCFPWSSWPKLRPPAAAGPVAFDRRRIPPGRVAPRSHVRCAPSSSRHGRAGLGRVRPRATGGASRRTALSPGLTGFHALPRQARPVPGGLAPVGAACTAARAAKNACRRSGSFTPGCDSTPDDTSKP